jgi:hypothetical protein
LCTNLPCSEANDVGGYQVPDSRTSHIQVAEYNGGGHRSSDSFKANAGSPQPEKSSALPFAKDWHNWADGKVGVKNDDELLEYQSARRTNGMLIDLHNRGYKILVDGGKLLANSPKQKKGEEKKSVEKTPNASTGAEVFIKIQREFADIAKNRNRDYLKLFKDMHGIDYDWQRIDFHRLSANGRILPWPNEDVNDSVHVVCSLVFTLRLGPE